MAAPLDRDVVNGAHRIALRLAAVHREAGEVVRAAEQLRAFA